MRHHPHDHHIFFNFESEVSLDAAAQQFERLSSALSERGELNLRSGNGESISVAPASPVLFAIRYEQMPRGEHKLRVEIEWIPDRSGRPQHGSTLEIG